MMWRYYISSCLFFFFNDTATTEIYTLSLHDALPISSVALQAGQIDLIIAASPTGLGPIRGGKARGLAVSTAQRSPAFPGGPTALEQGVDYLVANWFGFAFPKGAPEEAIQNPPQCVLT